MAKVQGTFYTGERLRRGTTPVSPPYAEDEGQPYPINPPGSNTIIGGIGIKLNSQVIGGVKRAILVNETLDIPIYWEYNIHGLTLDVDGVIQNNGEINVG